MKIIESFYPYDNDFEIYEKIYPCLTAEAKKYFDELKVSYSSCENHFHFHALCSVLLYLPFTHLTFIAKDYKIVVNDFDHCYDIYKDDINIL